MDKFLDLARRRRSVRKYLADPVDPAALERILEAARLAPSGNNSQPWRFIVIRSNEAKRQLYEVSGRQRWILDAPAVIAVVGNTDAKRRGYGRAPHDRRPGELDILLKTVRDTAIAAEHIVMAATDEGLGTCWIALFEQEDIRPILGVPDTCYVVAIITVGHAGERPGKSPRHPLSEMVFEEKYGRAWGR